jgi:diaminohydroxyphosphoribosylaminopyrimidine deaminase/5-amino-6-(5-phosphoribosylamino)uracil reductase
MQLPLNDGFIDLNSLMIQLADLECNDILVESGPTLNGRLLEQNFINEIILYLAPIIMGGKANPMFHNPVLQSMQKKINLKQKDSRYIGDNLRLVLEVLQY